MSVWLFGFQTSSLDDSNVGAEIVAIVERRDWDGKTEADPCTCGHNRWEHDRAGRCAVGSIGYEVPGWVQRLREELGQPQPDRNRPLCPCGNYEPRPRQLLAVVPSEKR
jgi:hypothetical protein